MRNRTVWILLSAVVLCGCGGPRWKPDARGWITYHGGYQLETEGVISVAEGCIGTSDMRWNGQRVSFSIYEEPNAPWAVYFFDENFDDARKRTLRSIPAREDGKILKRADKSRNSWTASIVIRLFPVRTASSDRTRIDALSVVNLHPSAISGQIEQYSLSSELRRGEWNRIVLDFSNGFVRCFINGKPGQDFRYDRRTNGGIGFQVARNHRLRIKNLTVGPIPIGKVGE